MNAMRKTGAPQKKKPTKSEGGATSQLFDAYDIREQIEILRREKLVAHAAVAWRFGLDFRIQLEEMWNYDPFELLASEIAKSWLKEVGLEPEDYCRDSDRSMPCARCVVYLMGNSWQVWKASKVSWLVCDQDYETPYDDEPAGPLPQLNTELIYSAGVDPMCDSDEACLHELVDVVCHIAALYCEALHRNLPDFERLFSTPQAEDIIPRRVVELANLLRDAKREAIGKIMEILNLRGSSKIICRAASNLSNPSTRH